MSDVWLSPVTRQRDVIFQVIRVDRDVSVCPVFVASMRAELGRGTPRQ